MDIGKSQEILDASVPNSTIPSWLSFPSNLRSRDFSQNLGNSATGVYVR